MAKKVIILGVTGSIGMNAVDVISSNPESFEVVAVAALRNRSRCEAVAAERADRMRVNFCAKAQKPKQQKLRGRAEVEQ